MPEPITMYGATHCGDTIRVRKQLQTMGIPFQDVNIDHDPDGERFVIFINNGNRSTPTMVVGEGSWKLVITEPGSQEVVEMVNRAGYES